MKTTTRYSPEFRQRAVRMVFEHQGEHKTQWAAIVSILARIFLHKRRRRFYAARRSEARASEPFFLFSSSSPASTQEDSGQGSLPLSIQDIWFLQQNPSPLFGQANQPAGGGGFIFSEAANNRRLELQMRFTF